jgi:hypothetical protein
LRTVIRICRDESEGYKRERDQLEAELQTALEEMTRAQDIAEEVLGGAIWEREYWRGMYEAETRSNTRYVNIETTNYGDEEAYEAGYEDALEGDGSEDDRYPEPSYPYP